MKFSDILLKIIPIILLTLAVSCQNPVKEPRDRPLVIMLSLDGFRWDYPEIYATPNLDKIKAYGVKAQSLIPVFPSKTFPNHYTIATGLYPDHHGIVNNEFVDPETGEMYSPGNRQMVEAPHFYGGEPIWVTAEKQGIPTASFYWIGSEAPVMGMHPSIWKKFDSSVPFETRMDSVISWANFPAEKRPGLITWYMEEPDHTSHDFGPFSKETGKVVQHLDSLVGVFLSRLDTIDNKNINIIVLSDHGMGEIRSEKYIDIDRNLKPEWIKYILGYNPVLFVEPEDGFSDTVLNTISQDTHLNAWKKENIPAYLKFGHNPRISKIVVEADSGWSIGTDENPDFTVGGAHGYDFYNTDMHAIFYAMGPSFKEGYIHPSFYNVDIYILLCKIMGLKPVETDGNYQRIRGMINEGEMSGIGQK